MKTTMPTSQLLEQAWATAMPGREVVSLNEAPRSLRALTPRTRTPSAEADLRAGGLA